MSQAQLPENSLIPKASKGSLPESMSPKTMKLLSRAMANMELNLREFLESHCGIPGARSLETPLDVLFTRMELMNVQVAHVRVADQPELNGVWVIKSGRPQVSFTDPVLRNGKPLIKMINLAPAPRIIADVKGRA